MKADFDVAAAHKYFAADCFNKAWDLIEKPDRSAEDNRLMVALSHASIYHWLQRPDCDNTRLSVGYWQASRIQSLPGNADEAEARSFYGKLLGLQELPKPAALAQRGGVWFQCGTLQLHLGVESDFHPAKKAHTAFVVDDLAQLAKDLAAAGYPIADIETLSNVRRTFTEDPFGNRVELVQQQLPSAASDST
ncbi:MAG: VOC family protein [Burkholderiaceae bacterium]